MIVREEQFKKVHPDLILVVQAASKKLKLPLYLIQGARTPAQQEVNLKNGKSQILKSRHIPSSNKSGFAEAIDMAQLTEKIILWKRLDQFQQINEAMQVAALQLRIPIVWGGSWKTFKDLDHWELDRRKYPAS